MIRTGSRRPLTRLTAGRDVLLIADDVAKAYSDDSPLFTSLTFSVVVSDVQGGTHQVNISITQDVNIRDVWSCTCVHLSFHACM